MHKRIFTRNDGEKLILFSSKEHTQESTTELDITEISKPHMRWNPSRQEWVTYSAGRKHRTAIPPKEYCPLCPSTNKDFPTEIPFDNFEIAVFPNRWASFNTHNQNQKPANGRCEVVVYSSKHNDTLAEMSIDQISSNTNDI